MPAVGRTWMAVVLPIVSVSDAPVPETVRVTVIVEASVTLAAALVIFLPTVNVALGVTAVLNSNPAGAFRIKVTPVPVAKSLVEPSAIVMVPRLVQAGEVAVAAVSASMAEPPEAPVTLTVAKAWPPAKRVIAAKATHER